MGVQDTFRYGAGLKQAETQKHGISSAAPDSGVQIPAQGKCIDQNGINADADHN